MNTDTIHEAVAQSANNKASESTKRSWVTRRTPMPERFWNKVRRGVDNECWPYTGHCHKFGHGAFKLNGVERGSHRMAWELTNGTIPAGLDVCHHCDNPPCCNPKHLFVGTHDDNMRDAASKHRFPHKPGEKSHRSKITDAQVVQLRKDYVPWFFTAKMLSRKYGISPGAVRDIIYRKHFAHI